MIVDSTTGRDMSFCQGNLQKKKKTWSAEIQPDPEYRAGYSHRGGSRSRWRSWRLTKRVQNQRPRSKRQRSGEESLQETTKWSFQSQAKFTSLQLQRSKHLEFMDWFKDPSRIRGDFFNEHGRSISVGSWVRNQQIRQQIHWCAIHFIF